MTTPRSFTAISIAIVFAACNQKPGPESRAAESPPPAAEANGTASAPAAPSAAAPQLGCTQNFEAFDGDGDKRVSLQEFVARPHVHPDPESIFKSRDADADGSLTSVEFCSAWEGRGPHMGMGPGTGAGHMSGMGPGMGMGPGGMGPGGMGPGKGMGPGGRRCEEHFARFDGNTDGSVTEQEFIALPHPHADPHAVFVARDQNHDGLLTAAEFCAPWSPPSPSTQTP